MCPAGDPSSLASGILSLAALSQVERQALGRAGRIRIKTLYGLDPDRAAYWEVCSFTALEHSFSRYYGSAIPGGRLSLLPALGAGTTTSIREDGIHKGLFHEKPKARSRCSHLEHYAASPSMEDRALDGGGRTVSQLLFFRPLQAGVIHGLGLSFQVPQSAADPSRSGLATPSPGSFGVSSLPQAVSPFHPKVYAEAPQIARTARGDRPGHLPGPRSLAGEGFPLLD